MDKPRENPARLDDERLAAAAHADARTSDAAKPHDAGSDANDTSDGLTESEEAVRHAAEDIPTGQDPAGSTESVPVFDRGSLPPKV